MIRKIFKFIFWTVVSFWAVLGFALMAMLLILSVSIINPFQAAVKPLHEDSVLSLSLNGPYVEHTETGGVESLFLGKKASLYNVTRAILNAANDKKIKGLVLRIESPLMGAAQIQELREALMVFRKTGKPSWCYTSTFGESSSGTAMYYLATACHTIWMQPVGAVNLTGLSMEVPFFKGIFEKLDIKPEMAQRKEYKSAVETYTRDDFSEPAREATKAIVDSILSQFVEGIAKERSLSPDQVRTLINNGPYLTDEALAEKLVDRIDYRHNLEAAIESILGKHVQFVNLTSYLQTFTTEPKGDKVALIFGSGTIVSDGSESPLAEVSLTENQAYKAFQEAIKDKAVKVIVYRINSGGGAPGASEAIYGLIHYAREKAHKQVIISMSDAAASGAYWIAVAGDKIVAQPATLTGSIGVFGGKFDASGLLDKIGVKIGQVSTSENASMWSMAQSFTPDQWVKLNGLMDQIYKTFTHHVAVGRRMTLEQVEKVARGRVWTGEQALALGLVDQLGGLHVALDLARKSAGLAKDAGVQIYPKPKSVLESLSVLMGNEEEISHVEAGLFGVILRPLNKVLGICDLLLSSQEVLYAPVGQVK